MKKHQLKQLKNYSAFSASFLLLADQSNAQIIYHDIDPDGVVYLDEYFLDFDNDGSADFKLIFTVDTNPGYLPDETKIRINPLGSNKVAYSMQTIPVTYSGVPSATYISGATQLYFTVAPVISEGETIDADLNFQTDIAHLYDRLFFYVYSSYNFETFLPGNWMGQANKFVGIQFYLDGQYHYGWIRLSLNADGMIVHDFAYEAMPDIPLETQIVNYSTAWLFAQDAGTTGTGEDLQFSFTAAGDEEDILGYRIICVKQGVADNFTADDAALVSPDQYIEIIPDGSAEYTSAFHATSKDSEGDIITTGQQYKLFVLNMMDPATGFANMISQPSASVELIDTVAVATENDLLDLTNNGDGSDLEVTFNSADPVQGISEFRVIVVKKDSADLFTLADAEALTPDRYTVALPGPYSFEIFLNASTLDSDGDLIEPAKYKSFVLSVADGTTAGISSLSAPSGSVTVEKETSVVNSVLLEDIAEFGDGRDIKISFAHPAIEQTIEEYRIYLANITDAFDFDLATALSISPENYFSVVPSGEDIVINADAATTDVSGNLIAWGVPYFAYVVSIASQYGLNDTLSAQSNQLIINFPVIEATNELNNENLIIFSSGNKIHISLQLPVPEEIIFTLTNIAGQQIFTAEITQQENVFELNVAEGIYLAQVRCPNEIFTKPLFIQKPNL